MQKNFIDKIVEQISPTAAVKRYQSKLKIDAADTEIRRYNAASMSRHTKGWVPMGESPNTEIHMALNILRARSRNLAKNNEYARNAARIIPNNTIGTGIMPTIDIIKTKGRNSNASLEIIKKTWESWASKITADYHQRTTLYGLQRLIMRTIQIDGECIIKRVKATSKYQIPLRLQVLSGEFIDTTKYELETKNGGTIYYGIEFNKDGECIGYWLYDKHPSEYATNSTFHPAEDIIHVFDIEEPGQIRGVPFSAASMLRIKDVDDYEFSERARAKVAACFAGFITDVNGEKTTDTEKQFDTIEPGTLTELDAGKTIVFPTPPTVNGYDAFIRSNLRGVASGNGITYESMTSDYSNVNFSSGRMGWLEFSRNVQHWQWNVLIPVVCDRIFDWFTDAIKLRGIISAETMLSVQWTAPRREMIDPYKETMARLEAVRAGFTTISEVHREDGYNSDDVFEQMKTDAQKIKDAGLMPTSDPRFDAQRKDGGDTGRTNAGASRD